MRITIIKSWQTEAEVDAPDGLSKQELIDWLAQEADKVANDLLDAEWTNTHCTETGTDIEVVEF